MTNQQTHGGALLFYLTDFYISEDFYTTFSIDTFSTLLYPACLGDAGEWRV